MNIYVAHSNKFDYINKIYTPIKESKLLKKHHFFFPHDEVNKEIKTKEIIKNYDLLIAEVSLPATGLGIELGWADDSQTPIVCMYEKGVKCSSSLKFITNNFIEYEGTQDMPSKIFEFIEKQS